MVAQLRGRPPGRSGRNVREGQPGVCPADRRGGRIRRRPPDVTDVVVALDGERSFGTLVRDVVTSVQELFRAEIRLARTEITEDVTRLKRASIFFAATGALAALALAFLLL